MAKDKKYNTRPKMSRLMKSVLLFAASLGMAVLYFWIYTSVLEYELPKTALLKKKNAEWCSKMEVMNRHLDEYALALESLQMRDDDIYRSIFGMDEIPLEVRNAGFGGVNRYQRYDLIDNDGLLKKTAIRLDVLTKKTYVQSRSFDEVAALSKRAGDMASCIPAIPPISPDRKKYRLSSVFGYRSDPMSGRRTMHKGVDFAMKPGNPVYATGDGVVESVSFEFFGYGNSLVIDHGFGYMTRYAHLHKMLVKVGDEVERGEQIATMGNTGNAYGIVSLASYDPVTKNTVVVMTSGAKQSRDKRGIYKICGEITKSVYKNIDEL